MSERQARPFIVRSDGRLSARSERSSMCTEGECTVVTVVEGRVAVANPVLQHPLSVGGIYAGAIFLVAGEQVTVPAKESAKEGPKPKRADVAIATAGYKSA